jgi:hypothetical protein
MRSSNLGFTRVETALLLVFIVAVAAMVVPITRRELTFARGAAARAQCESVARTISLVLEHARIPPTEGGYGPFVGDGQAPASLPAGATSIFTWTGSKPPEAIQGLITGKWKGPYMHTCEPDPWGRAIVLTCIGDPRRFIWCVSAGENGILETTARDRWPKGDDIAVRVY